MSCVAGPTGVVVLPKDAVYVMAKYNGVSVKLTPGQKCDFMEFKADKRTLIILHMTTFKDQYTYEAYA